MTGSGSESCWVTGRAGSGLGPGGEAEAGLSLAEREEAMPPRGRPLVHPANAVMLSPSLAADSRQLSGLSVLGHSSSLCAPQRLPGS